MSRPAHWTGPCRRIAKLRADFPALEQHVHGKPLAYLDNAASAQAPRAVSRPSPRNSA